MTATSKFEYDSTIAIDGVSYKSGFGLKAEASSDGSGTEDDPYKSTFWVNAERFVFTNDNKTGSTSPFTIDASGTEPEVYFNGRVNFNNIDGTGGDNLMHPAYSTFDAAELPQMDTCQNLTKSITSNPSLVKFGGRGLICEVYDSSAYIYLCKFDGDFNILLPANVDVIISAYIYMDGGNGNVGFLKSKEGASSQGYSFSIPTNEWHRIHWAFNTEDATKFLIGITTDGYEDTNYNIAIDGIMVEVAKPGQTEPSAFTRPVSNVMTDVTTIDGGNITTGTIDASRINTNEVLAKNIVVNDGKITAANGSMVIDFLNGSIYIQ